MSINIRITAVLCLLFFLNSCQNTPPIEETTAESEKTDSYYTEQHRPQYHFSPDSMWMNDPNGMVFYEGEYHLFYQYYPDDNVWGPMHWGHAISKDLITWEHLPIGLFPDSLGYIFSGSAVVDWNNTSGLGTDGRPPLIAIFTYHLAEREKEGHNDFQTQGIAYSNDKGRTWTKYEGNPVIKNENNIRDFRDPKVFWYEEGSHWVMVFARGDQLQIYNSPNLKDWTLTSEWGLGHGSQARPWECPDLFELPIEGTDQSKWVMLVSLGTGGPNGGSATQYFIGDFDGQTFTNDNPKDQTLWIDHGRDNYAGVTWSDIAKTDGRRIFLGWMSNWEYAQQVPTEVWRSAMTLPRTLSLQNTPEGVRLVSTPVKETQRNRKGVLELASKTLTEDWEITSLLNFSASMMEAQIEMELPADATTKLGLELSNDQGGVYRIGFDQGNNQYFSDRTQSGKLDFSEKFATSVHTADRVSDSNTIKLHFFFDVSSVELFADDGLNVMTELYFPSADFNTVKIFVEGGSVELKKGVFYEMKRIW